MHTTGSQPGCGLRGWNCSPPRPRCGHLTRTAALATIPGGGPLAAYKEELLAREGPAPPDHLQARLAQGFSVGCPKANLADSSPGN